MGRGGHSEGREAGPMVSLWDLSSFRHRALQLELITGEIAPSQLHNSTDPGAGAVTGRCEGLDRHTQELEAAQMSQS